MFALRRQSALAARSFSTSARAFKEESTASVVQATQRGGNQVAEVRPEGTAVQAGVVSGAPDEIYHRPVRIYRPSPPTTSSAKATSHHWRIDWDILPGANRWENPLMGWASSADYLQGTHVKFDTKEQAMHFCEKQGYEYFVQEPAKTKFVPKSYSTNYLYRSKPLRIVHTK